MSRLYFRGKSDLVQEKTMRGSQWISTELLWKGYDSDQNAIDIAIQWHPDNKNPTLHINTKGAVDPFDVRINGKLINSKLL